MFTSGPVRVPCARATSANLGPGFDALGLALTLTTRSPPRCADGGDPGRRSPARAPARCRPTPSTWSSAAMRPRSTRSAYAPPGLALTCHNRIPQRPRAGLLLGRDRGRRPAGPRAGCRRRAGARRRRGAAAGGRDRGAPRQRRAVSARRLHDRLDRAGAGAGRCGCRPAPGVRPTVFVPAERGLTATARAALPATVPHADAAFNAGRAALLVHALTSDPACCFDGHRGPAAPGLPGTGHAGDRAALVARLRAAGVAAVVSGAGPERAGADRRPRRFDAGHNWRESGGAGRARRSAARDRGTVEHAEGDPVAAGHELITL